MTLTTDSKRRVTIPSAAAGDVFACEQTDEGILLRRIYRRPIKKKLTKAQVLKKIRNWKHIPNMSWEELRAITREL